jgi:hypothetical protein
MKIWRLFLVLSLFVLVVVSTWSIRRQFLAESKERDYNLRLSSQEYYWIRAYESLKKSTASSEQILDAEEQLASVLALEHQYKLVNALYIRIWRERAKASGQNKYNAKLIHTLQSMAFLDLDLGDIKACEYCYKTAWDYDRKWLPAGDTRITRDLNNLGVVHYLLALSCTDKLERQLEFERSNFFLLQSLISCGQGKVTREQQANILDNQYLALRDTERLNEAKATKEQAEKMHLLIPGRFNAP